MAEPIVVVKDLSVHVEAHKLVGPVDFEVHGGAITCLLGRNGSGKTSALRAVMGLASYTGSARVRGIETRDLDARVRARSVAYVPQQSRLHAALPVSSVVAQGRYAATGRVDGDGGDPVVEAAMRRTDVSALRSRAFPTLSLGEQRRVLVARALATEAPCLLLDEPDAYLDVGQRVRLFGLLRELRDDGIALLVVVHALTQARESADSCLVMDEGRVVSRGTPREALTPEILRTVFAVDAVEDAAPRYVLPSGGAA